MSPTAALMPVAKEVAALARSIDAAPEVTALAGLAADIRGLAIELIEQDAGAGILTRVLSGLNDRLTTRIIALIVARHRLPAAGWCWLTMGSEGRGEQTFVTDQDNGLVFSATDHAEARALRPLFLAMAGEVNQALAVCGFPLCDGGIMAGNEAWCLSVEEWRQHFSRWIRMPEPKALLNATIFFDLRALHGDASLAGSLRQQVQRLAPPAAGFLHMMAVNAVSVSPPLGRLRDFVDADGHKGCVARGCSSTRRASWRWPPGWPRWQPSTGCAPRRRCSSSTPAMSTPPSWRSGTCSASGCSTSIAGCRVASRPTTCWPPTASTVWTASSWSTA